MRSTEALDRTMPVTPPMVNNQINKITQSKVGVKNKLPKRVL
jgi:hypothetical protein